MTFSLLRKAVQIILVSMVSLLAVSNVRAHDPFDFSSRMTVAGDQVELTVTMGLDGVRELLAGAGLTKEEIAATIRAVGPDAVVQQSPTLARHFFELTSGGETLAARNVVSHSEGMEVLFTLNYPRPTAGVLEVRAACYDTIAGLRVGSLIAYDESMTQLGAALLSRTSAQLTVPLPSAKQNAQEPGSSSRPDVAPNEAGAGTGAATESAATASLPAARPSFSEYLKLGVEHILSGFDHLLFLAALLIGVRRPVAMFGIISCFTLGHSITLGLAALNVVWISPRVVEQLIALSIIVVAVENLVRKDAITDRYWMAGGFGLMHGFGFASVLSETGLGQGGSAIAMPLFSFNLGVELGQLAVMAIVVPGLFALRRWPAFARRGSTVLSVAVIAMSGYWLWERV
jgi:hypothetical protein